MNENEDIVCDIDEAQEAEKYQDLNVNNTGALPGNILPAISILDYPAKEARKFFLKTESYSNFNLPSYISFEGLLESLDNYFNKNPFSCKNARQLEKVNHVIFNNKDGKHAWRPIELINPAIYVSLVRTITDQENWSYILEKFKEFASCEKIECCSYPVESSRKDRCDSAEQISNWWSSIEQRSIELALEYQYLFHADIADCYGSIYTHSIAWALHTKPIAKLKENRFNKKLIGNLIDWHIQDMSHGQTNGIPQGSILMDFIAEIILGYVDFELSTKLCHKKISNYKILRYRDDYRIFVNNPRDGEVILKILSEILSELGLKLHGLKTKFTSNVIEGSIKPHKLSWLLKKQYAKNFQKQLLIIYNHSRQFPNSGGLNTILIKFYKKIISDCKLEPLPLISIITNIACDNPVTYPVCVAILSRLVDFFKTKEQKSAILRKIISRFKEIPNSGHFQIWLQWIALKVDRSRDCYTESLCKLVNGESCSIWNIDWLPGRAKRLFEKHSIVDKNEVESLPAVIPEEEIDIFFYN